MAWLWDVAGLLSSLALVALNGFFVAAEFSLVAVRKTRLEELIAQAKQKQPSRRKSGQEGAS